MYSNCWAVTVGFAVVCAQVATALDAGEYRAPDFHSDFNASKTSNSQAPLLVLVRPQIAKAIPQSSVALTVWGFFFMWFIFCSITSFGNRGMDYVGEHAAPDFRNFTFHKMAMSSTIVTGAAHVLTFFSLPSPLLVPWSHYGRCVASVITFVTLGYFCGSRCADLRPGVFALCCAWIQIVGASVVSEHILRWGLFFSGFCSGASALHVLSNLIGKCTFDKDQIMMLYPPIDLFIGCSRCYLLAWFCIEGMSWINPEFGSVLYSLIDAVIVCGCAHLVLKRKEVMDTVLWFHSSGV